MNGRSGSRIILNFLTKVRDLREAYVLRHKFKNFKKKLDKEIKNNEEKLIFLKNLVLCEVESEAPLFLSFFSNYLMDKYEDYVIVVYKEKEGEVVGSIRSKKRDLLSNMKEAFKNFEGISFGGHERAIGFRVRRTLFKEFIKVLEKILF